MNDEFDNLLKRKFKEVSIDSNFHVQVDEIVGNIFKKKRRRKKFLLIILPLIFTTTTVFAIGYSIFNLSSVGIDDSCIELAAQNGYIQTVNSEIQEYNGLGVGIDKFLIDDINMIITFKYELSNEMKKGLNNIYIQDLYIYDENNNVIFNENEKSETKSFSATSGYSKIEDEGNTLKSTFFAQSDNYPKSEKIYINFNTIILNYKNNNEIINGQWKYEIDVLEKMKNRYSIEYVPISNNTERDISIKSVKLTNTGLIINAVSDDSEKLNKAKIELIINNQSIKPNNNVFEKQQQDLDKKVEYIYTYNVIYNNAPEQLIVKIKEKNKEKEITFIKNE